MSLGNPFAPGNTGLSIALTGASQAVNAVGGGGGNIFYCYNASNTPCFVDFFPYTATNTTVLPGNTGTTGNTSNAPTGVPIGSNFGLLLAAPWAVGNSGWVAAVSANTGGYLYAMPGYGTSVQ